MTVIANGLFLLSGLKVDLSVLFYGFIAVAIYFVTFGKQPPIVMSNVHKTMLSCLDAPMILFDYEDMYVESNEDLQHMFPMIEFDQNTMTLQTFAEKAGLKELKGGLSASRSFQWTNTNGEIKKIYECRCICLLSQLKKKKGELLIFHNITSLIEAYEGEKSARKANNAKSEFLANMSHEIRTPINAILGMNEMILRESKDEQIQQYAENIETSGHTLLALINDILDFSKIESGKIEIVPVEYQLSSVINDLVNMIKPKADKKHLSFEVLVDSKIPNFLFGDEIRIRQIITNILGNAVKYTDQGSIKLIVKYRMIPEREHQVELYLAVRDTGRGIRSSEIDGLFESFQRADLKKNRGIEGTGLGLAITKRLVELMKGTIGVESEYGKGSTFFVRIPQKVVDFTPMGDYEEKYRESTKKSKVFENKFVAPEAKILIVDDNAVNLMVEESLIKQTKVKVETADSGEVALSYLRKRQYDLVLLDHMMPGMDGIDTLKAMKKENLNQGVPVLVLTANAISGARDMYLEYGFQDYLSKPVSGYQLEKALLKWLPEKKIQKISRDLEGSTVKNERPQAEELASIIDVEKALIYSPDGMEGVLKNIGFYLENANVSRQNLTQAVEKEEIQNYRNYAHSLKSSSALIGATKMSEFALIMENKSKDGDLEFIKEHHEEFISMYEQLCRQLQVYFDSQTDTNQQRKKSCETMKEQLKQMEAAAKNWDMVKVGEQLKQMEDNYANTYLTDTLRKQQQRLRKAYENMDFEEFLQVINEMNSTDCGGIC